MKNIRLWWANVNFLVFICRRVRELESRGIIMTSMRETKGRSLDSLSDLTNIDFDMDFSQYDKERLVFV